MSFSDCCSSSKLFCIIWVFFLIGRSDAQALANTTDLTEVQALNTTLNGWGISALTTQNPCNDNSFAPDNWQFECNCDSTDGFCHITELTVKGASATGPISEQLGNLRFLTSLDISMNDFIGTLPPVLGNLTSLQILRLNSLGPRINGKIPSSFANLKDLQSLWISDNNFTGNLPVFFGDLTNLTDLRMQGNSFQGPIPTTYRDLINLKTLQIGELLSATEDLNFITGISSLETLILRNTLISGIIPNQTSWTNMKELDLSFNNISGTIPESLFELPTLKYLFLGSNNLTGFLPNQKNSNLTTIDVSYNELSGTFPSWVQDGTLNLNFIFNNFNNISSADMNNSNGNLPRHLDCLQKNISCIKGTPKQTNFAVNSGSSIVVTNDAKYEADNSGLGPANYYVQDNKRWAVSNVGIYIDGSDSNYIQNIGSRFPNSQSSELFQAARISPSSLRYYGIGLENGEYNVVLQFAETDNWEPNGLRLFDILMQDELVAKNFNIYREAGNRTLRALIKNYITNVANNFLHIHFFWAGKGTCCLPTNGFYGPLISAISVTKNDSNQENSDPTNKTNIGLIVGLTVLAFVLSSVLIVGLFLWRKSRRGDNFFDDEELQQMSTRLKTYSYSELKKATNDFNENNLLGQGGFGPVYKGIDSDGIEIAVKKLSVESVQGKKQFVTEICTISTIQHRNLVKLHGCCYEGIKRLLVYEYMPNRSLDKTLFEEENTTQNLDWPTRFKILLGTARGLMYLHEESAVHIVHRDVKASNILLDVDLNPKVSDFGLAKLRDDTKSHISTGVAGTVGYLAPEYAMRGQLTEKADVFGFGVVALEVIYGRPNTDHSLGMEKTYLLEWAWHNYEEKRELEEIIDPKLLTSMNLNRDEVSRMIGIAILCTQTSPTRRPAMSKVVAMLIGDLEVPEVLTKPSYLMDFRYTEGEGNSAPFDATEGLKTSTKASAFLEIGEGR